MLANWKKRVFPLNRRQAVFAMLLCLVLAVNAVPALRASALYLITDGEATTAVEQGNLRTGGQRVHHKNAARGILLLAAFLCGKCRAAAARKAACNGEREYIAAFAKGRLPVRDVRAGAEGAALRAAKCCDHRVDVHIAFYATGVVIS